MAYRDTDSLPLTQEITTSIKSGSDSSGKSAGAPTIMGSLASDNKQPLLEGPHKTPADLPMNRPSVDSNHSASVRFTNLGNNFASGRPTQARRATKIKLGQEIRDLSSRKTRVAEKVLSRTPETQGKIISFKYNFSTNTFELYNPYAYEISFLPELKTESVILALGENLPDPAQSEYLKRTKLTFYIFVFPVLLYLSYLKLPVLLDVSISYKLRATQAMLYTMYVAMLGLLLTVQFVYTKNKYFDWMHTRGKVMKAVLKEVNALFYEKKDVQWTAGKYGLFFYGTLRKRRLYLRGRSESEALEDTDDLQNGGKEGRV